MRQSGIWKHSERLCATRHPSLGIGLYYERYVEKGRLLAYFERKTTYTQAITVVKEARKLLKGK